MLDTPKTEEPEKVTDENLFTARLILAWRKKENDKGYLLMMVSHMVRTAQGTGTWRETLLPLLEKHGAGEIGDEELFKRLWKAVRQARAHFEAFARKALNDWDNKAIGEARAFNAVCASAELVDSKESFLDGVSGWKRAYDRGDLPRAQFLAIALAHADRRKAAQ